jgi:hypothetical protein
MIDNDRIEALWGVQCCNREPFPGGGYAEGGWFVRWLWGTDHQATLLEHNFRTF